MSINPRLWFILALTPLFGAETITANERFYLIGHLKMTRQFVIDATRGLTKEQWLHKETPNRRSIVQCIDHLALTEDYIGNVVRERMLTSDTVLPTLFPSLASNLPNPFPPGKPKRMTRADDGPTYLMMTDRSAAALPVESRPPIEEVAPRAEIADPQTALDHFLRTRAATIEFVQTTQEDLHGHYGATRLPQFPGVRYQDAYQWILRMSAHTERRLVQANEVKEAKGYPRTRP